MYRHILIPLENTKTDEAILTHIRLLAKFLQARLTVIHVADGFLARNQQRFGESDEMRRDQAYLTQRESELRADGFEVNSILATGNPAAEVLAAAEREHCDLIAMATHGHRFLSDLIRGSVASDVHHRARVPVLLVRA
jgi:nucleotide-binding universal stress UspA family protein